jgi:CO/xanthine dehydrogenase Mo-binding subunit
MPLKLCERPAVKSAELTSLHTHTYIHTHEGIGAAVPRVGAKRLVQGQARYCDDIELPRMVHVCFLRSPYAHARILSVDTKAARAMPGVVSVITGADLREHCEPFLGVLKTSNCNPFL